MPKRPTDLAAINQRLQQENNSLKQIEAELLFQKNLLENQIEVALDGILVISEEGKWLFYNQRFIEMWAIPESIIASGISDVARQWMQKKLIVPEQFSAKIKYLYENKYEKSWDELYLKDGRILERYSAPVTNKKGIYYGRVWYYRDVSERKQAEMELRKQTAQFEALYQVGLKLTSELELNSLLQTIVSQAAKLLDTSLDTLYLCQPDGQTLKLVATSNPRAHPVGTLLQRGQGLTGKVLETGHPVIVNDYMAWEGKISDWEGKVGHGSAVGVPIRWGQEMQGVLSIASKPGYRFTTTDIQLLNLFAAQAAVAIQNARLHDEVQDYVANLEKEITERKRAEEALKTYTAELERSNRELEDFAYISSHDLQEPLRKIQSFSDRMQIKYGDALDERGMDYLVRMQIAASRMQALIQDLLAFSRVTTKTEPFVLVDLNQVVQGVLSDLETRIDEVKAKIEVGELPTLEADPAQMRQLMQNLLSNALKFHHPREMPFVNISAQPLPRSSTEDQTCLITVKDNGIGFDEKYVDRIFGVFQRLHGRDQYEGTGVGLAICKKIVDRHHGRIEATSQPGSGATFLITLPLKQPTAIG